MALWRYLQGAKNMPFWQTRSMSSQHQKRPSSVENSDDHGKLPVTGAQTKTRGAKQPGDLHETRPKEIGGRDGPEPTRFGDWEKAGRCIDF